MSLIAHYPLNGDARDYFGNNGVETNVTYTAGKIGQAAEFNGTNNSFIDCGNPEQFQLVSSVSLSCWVKTTSTSAWDRIISKGYDNSWFLGMWSTNGTARFRVDSSTGIIGQLESSVQIIDGVWHHITGTYDGSMLKLYIDGILDNQVSGSGVLNRPSSNFWIGGVDYTSNSLFDGLIDDVRIYDHALSEKEVSEVYKTLALSKFPEVNDNTSDSGNFITVPDSPTILGDTSIEMWL